jgi:hypothetical protein
MQQITLDKEGVQGKVCIKAHSAGFGLVLGWWKWNEATFFYFFTYSRFAAISFQTLYMARGSPEVSPNHLQINIIDQVMVMTAVSNPSQNAQKIK